MGRQKKFLVVTLLMAVLATASAKEFYVAPNGSPNGDGSIDNPWDLRTALSHPPQVKPGDIIWIRGGVYKLPIEKATGNYAYLQVKLKGIEEKPIIVRAYPGERVIIDGAGMKPLPNTDRYFILVSDAAYVWLWGLEITNSDPDRTYTLGGINVLDSIGVKLINNVIHRNGGGIGAWVRAQNLEIYGNILWNNWHYNSDQKRLGSHEIYTQNLYGKKYIIDNVIYRRQQYYAIKAAGSEIAYVYGYYIEGNMINGTVVVQSLGDYRIKDITIKDNYILGGISLGFQGRYCEDAVVINNVISSKRDWKYNRCIQTQNWRKLTIKNNICVAGYLSIIADYSPFIPDGLEDPEYDWDNNIYYWDPHYKSAGPRPLYWYDANYPGGLGLTFEQWQQKTGFDKNSQYNEYWPKGQWVYIRPNKYEPGRAHIAVFNYDLAHTVTVDLKDILPIGTPFEVRSFVNFTGNPVYTGIYDGKPIVLPMTTSALSLDPSLYEAQNYLDSKGNPLPPPEPPYPDFMVFIVLPKYPSVPQIIAPADNEQVVGNLTFRLKAYDEFPLRFVVEIAKGGETKTYVTDYTASGVEMTYTVPETLPPGTYTARVKAQDKYGRESPYAGPITIVIKSPPSPPILIEPKNGSAVVSTPTFKVKATHPEGKQVKFLIEVKRSEEVKIFETDLVNSGEEVTFTVPPEQALEEGTYTWRVKVKDEEGLESKWSEAWNFTVNNPPSAPTLISPKENAVVSSTPTFTVKADDPSGERVRIRVEVLDKEGNILLQLTTSEVDSGQEVNVSLPPDKALAPGTYYWRAVAGDRWMEGPYSETRRFHVFAMSRRITKGLSFISVPLRTEQSWSDLLELPEDQLKVVTWDPLNNRYVYASAARAPNGSAVDENAARPYLGRGYWVKLDTDKEVRLVGHSVDKEEVAIDLQPGWNIIGYPFTKPIQWDLDSIKVRRLGEVKSLREAWMAGWLEGYLWGWKQNSRNPDTGNYFLVYDENILPESVSVMEPFNAYWVRAHVECQLILEPPKGEGLTKLSRQRNFVGNGLGICINAKLNDVESKAFIGVGSGTRLQAVEPPTPPTGKLLQVVVSSGEQEFVADVKDKMSQRMMWELTVRWMPTRGQQGEISLSFDGIASIPKDYSVFLVDKTTGERRYLRTTPVYRFTPHEGEAERRFVLLVEQTGSRLLRILNLKAQPVRGQGVIVKFRLTKAAQTTAEILTLTGRTVAVVETEQPRPAGEHLLLWRGTNDYRQPVGIGAYLVRVHAVDEEGRRTQSFTIVRLR